MVALGKTKKTAYTSVLFQYDKSMLCSSQLCAYGPHKTFSKAMDYYQNCDYGLNGRHWITISGYNIITISPIGFPIVYNEVSDTNNHCSNYFLSST